MDPSQVDFEHRRDRFIALKPRLLSCIEPTIIKQETWREWPAKNKFQVDVNHRSVEHGTQDTHRE